MSVEYNVRTERIDQRRALALRVVQKHLEGDSNFVAFHLGFQQERWGKEKLRLLAAIGGIAHGHTNDALRAFAADLLDQITREKI